MPGNGTNVVGAELFFIALACAKKIVVVCQPLLTTSLQKEASKKVKVLIASII